MVLVLDVYGVVFGLAVRAAGVTRPHVVTPDELRIRLGAFFDLRIPRELISSVRLSRNYNEPGRSPLADGRLGVAVSSQTNVIVELTEPVTVVRPLGSRRRGHHGPLLRRRPGRRPGGTAPRPAGNRSTTRSNGRGVPPARSRP